MQAIREAGLYADVGSLYLHAATVSAKSWILRATLRGTRVLRSIGPTLAVTLAEACETMQQWQRMMRAGDDPRPGARARREAAEPTSDGAARAVYAAACASLGGRAFRAVVAAV